MSETPPPEPPETTEQVGDPACWMERLCPDCGAMPSPGPDGAPPATCWRCGADLRPGPA